MFLTCSAEGGTQGMPGAGGWAGLGTAHLVLLSGEMLLRS